MIAAAGPSGPARAAERAPARPPEIALGAAQLVLGAGAEIGGGLALVALGLNPKNFSSDSDYALLGAAAVALPVFAGGAVCATGYFSRHYRGRCSTTFLGAYAGAALGVVLGFALAPAPGPDDTESFMRAMSGLAGVVFLTPIGAVVGYHLGKQEIEPGGAPLAAPPPPVAAAPTGSSAWEPRRGPIAEPAARRLMLPLFSLNW